ncbi:YitT family protein [Enterococcus nangangensis]|uniref:YitT family protein n=1 Tax=Enterococcus nangangensis TaxID=2559926 RepID=UPI0010F651BE|nr:YitT family protein [Enterococcus nangangensis]
MKKFTFKILKIALACLLLAIAINLFLAPHDIAAGGVSGIGILLEATLQIPRALVVLVLNVVMLVLALFFLGKKVFFNTLYGSILFPFFLEIVPGKMVASDRLLSVIVGSAIFAVGVATLYQTKASSGGTTIPPLIFEKYFHLSTSIGLLLTDTVIVFASLYVFGFEEFLFAIFSLVITSIVMAYMETGFDRKKAVMIFSLNNTQVIRQTLLEKFDRSLTIFDARGGQADEGREMILIIVSDKEYLRVKELVHAVDPTTFMVAYNVSDVNGRGFTYHPIQ